MNAIKLTLQNRTALFISIFPILALIQISLVMNYPSFFRKYFSNIDFKIVMTNPFKISSLFFFKDELPKHMLASVVYKFSCVQCTSEYMGSTIPPRTPSTAELLSIVAEVSALTDY